MLPRNLHDALIQRVFDSPAEIEGFLCAVLPAPISRAIRRGSLKLVHARKTGNDLRSRVPDFVCSAELAGTEMLLSVVVEHQSHPDLSMPLRMIGTAIKVWEHQLRRRPRLRSGPCLPPVLPIVVYHGAHSWRGPTNTFSMVQLPQALHSAYRRYQPCAEFVLVDLSTVPDEILSAAAMSAFARLALLLLKHVRSPDFPHRLAGFGGLLLELTRIDGGWDAVEVLLSYAIAVAGPITIDRIGEAVAPALGERGREMVMTLAERLIAEGKQLGRQEGRQQGRQEGRQEGRREARREVALRLSSRGQTVEQIAELLGTSVEEVRELLGQEAHS